VENNIEGMNITILLPVYNDEAFIERTILSIMGQTYKNFICIIGFNGTKDLSKEIVNRLVENDDRFKIFDYGSESGKSKTLNKMLAEVKTERLCLIDGDDIWVSDKLEKQIKFSPYYDVIGTLASYIDESDNIFHNLKLSEGNDEICSSLLKGNNQIVNSSCMVNTGDVLSVGGWNSDEGLEDFDLWVKLYKKSKTFYNIQEYLVNHRIHPGSNFNSKKLSVSVYDILYLNGIK
jgi:glycosyltransferase involved in cell wall biosynthesis